MHTVLLWALFKNNITSILLLCHFGEPVLRQFLFFLRSTRKCLKGKEGGGRGKIGYSLFCVKIFIFLFIYFFLLHTLFVPTCLRSLLTKIAVYKEVNEMSYWKFRYNNTYNQPWALHFWDRFVHSQMFGLIPATFTVTLMFFDGLALIQLMSFLRVLNLSYNVQQSRMSLTGTFSYVCLWVCAFGS